MNEENACSQGNCYYPETSCQLGHLSECPNMKKSKHHSDIPLNVNNIGYDAFSDCDKLSLKINSENKKFFIKNIYANML